MADAERVPLVQEAFWRNEKLRHRLQLAEDRARRDPVWAEKMARRHAEFNAKRAALAAVPSPSSAAAVASEEKAALGGASICNDSEQRPLAEWERKRARRRAELAEKTARRQAEFTALLPAIAAQVAADVSAAVAAALQATRVEPLKELDLAPTTTTTSIISERAAATPSPTSAPASMDDLSPELDATTELTAPTPTNCLSKCQSHDASVSLSRLLSTTAPASSTTKGDVLSVLAAPAVSDKAFDVDAMCDTTRSAAVCLPAGPDHNNCGEDLVSKSLTLCSAPTYFSSLPGNPPSSTCEPTDVLEPFMWSFTSSSTIRSGHSLKMPPSLMPEAYMEFSIGPNVSTMAPWPPPSCTRAGPSLIFGHDLCHNEQQKRSEEFSVMDSKENWHAIWLRVELKPPWLSLGVSTNLPVGWPDPPWPPPTPNKSTACKNFNLHSTLNIRLTSGDWQVFKTMELNLWLALLVSMFVPEVHSAHLQPSVCKWSVPFWYDTILLIARTTLNMKLDLLLTKQTTNTVWNWCCLDNLYAYLGSPNWALEEEQGQVFLRMSWQWFRYHWAAAYPMKPCSAIPFMFGKPPTGQPHLHGYDGNSILHYTNFSDENQLHVLVVLETLRSELFSVGYIWDCLQYEHLQQWRPPDQTTEFPELMVHEHWLIQWDPGIARFLHISIQNCLVSCHRISLAVTKVVCPLYLLQATGSILAINSSSLLAYLLHSCYAGHRCFGGFAYVSYEVRTIGNQKLMDDNFDDVDLLSKVQTVRSLNIQCSLNHAIVGRYRTVWFNHSATTTVIWLFQLLELNRSSKQAEVKGTRNLAAATNYHGHYLNHGSYFNITRADQDYYIDVFSDQLHIGHNYYVGVFLTQVGVVYFLNLVKVCLDYGFHRDLSEILKHEVPWDPGGFTWYRLEVKPKFKEGGMLATFLLSLWAGPLCCSYWAWATLKRCNRATTYAQERITDRLAGNGRIGFGLHSFCLILPPLLPFL